VTRSEFLRALSDEFGEVMSHSVSTDVIIGALRNRSAMEALDAGIEPKVVWAALCEVMDVPSHRRHGVGLIDPKPE
jgi:hypothetical protein